MRRTRVKICGITRVADVGFAVAAGADAIGLNFYPPSPRYVSAAVGAELAQACPAMVSVVALFVNPERGHVIEVMEQVHPAVLQFHGDEPQQFCASFGLPYMKAVRVDNNTDISRYGMQYQDAAALLLDTRVDGVPGGTGRSFDWSLVPEQLPQALVLAGGLTPDNVATAIAATRPYAVDVSGGVERAAGEKDAELMQAFVAEVCRADTALET